MTACFSLKQLETLKVVPVIVVQNIEEALSLGKLLIEEGLPIAEVTFRSEAAYDAVCALKDSYPELCVGAGTILNVDQVKKAEKAGADFIVSPGFNVRTVHAAQDANIPIVPGINNPMGVEAALEEGLSLLKFFPAEASGGINMIKALLAPYREIQLMPTGGINEQNVTNYLKVDRVIACGLSWMVDSKLIAEGNWEALRDRMRQIKKLVA